MIEPELFNFKPPVNKHTYVKKRWDKLLENIDEYGLTHSVTVVLPDTIFIPSYIEKLFSENGQYYLVKDVTLYSLIDPGFVTSFVKNGKVYAISLNTHIDVEDCISINNNLLKMALIQSSIQNICLPTKDSKITLDLNQLKFKSKFYQRIKECFERFQTKFDLLVCWEPNTDDICPSSIASYFNKKEFDCQECFPRLTTNRKYNMTIPTGTDITLLDTWLSYFCLDIKINDDKISTLLPCGKLTKSNSRDIGQVTQIVWTGFFNNDKVKLLLQTFRDFAEKENKSCWLAIHLESFTNSPYSCAHRTILLNLDDTYYVSQCTNCKQK